MAIAKTAKQMDKLLKSGASVLNGLDGIRVDEDTVTEKETKKEKQSDALALEAAMVEVNAVLEYTPNNSLFGSAYHRTLFPIGLWAYNKYVNKPGKFQKWMFKAFAS